ncbi:MAG: DMT family transporter [Eubacterium sp.]|nr:DMT family transporter [Eubacterium sp.]
MNSDLIKNNKYRPFFAAFCALGWSLAYPLIKLGYSEFGISGDLASNVLFAGVRFSLAGILVLIFGKTLGINLKVKDKNLWAWIISFGLINTALHYMFAYMGLSRLPSSRGTILDSMGGFFLILLSGLLFKEDKITFKKIIGCIFGLFGIVLINIAPINELFSDISFTGDGFILINACFAALGGIMTRKISEKINITAATGYSMLIGGAVMIVLGFIIGIKSKWNITVKGLLILLALVLISAVCFEIYNLLLSFHPISKVAIFNALIPVLGVMFSSLILGEPFKWQYLAAGLSVAIGIAIINKTTFKE